ncbi:MAG: flagellar biosynthesis protein FlhB [Firmicutes bacterium]|nr:flagellar biosynthesis protein FlhB [Bacillota bacterium]
MRKNREDNKRFLVVNLQLFAEDKESKTEKATPKKRQDAKKKGQVFQSKEISSAFLLLLVFLCMKAFGKQVYEEVTVFINKALVQYMDSIEALYTIEGFSGLFIDIITILLKTAGPIIGVAVIAGLAGTYAQVGFIFTIEPITMKLSRINPMQGFKRIFSSRGAAELFKALIKIVVVGYVAYLSLKGEGFNILKLMYIGVGESGIYIINTVINTALKICMVLVVFGIADYGYQWWEYEKNLKMSKQEIKEEYKQVEGNPEVKSRIKQKQRQMSMKRMMHEVQSADVVITNPTHYAVAIKYDSNIHDAPIVVAKGQNYIALRIKDIARENEVEIVENKELARIIYNTVEVGQAIPPELYQAVAEILAYIYNLKGIVKTD